MTSGLSSANMFRPALSSFHESILVLQWVKASPFYFWREYVRYYDRPGTSGGYTAAH